MNNYATVNEVAKRYGLTNRQVLYALNRGHIEGDKVGWIWLIDTSTLPVKWPVRVKRSNTRDARNTGR